MSERINPLAAFFRAVLDELRRRVFPEEFADMLEGCDVDSETANV
jgi:hypothetical protein